MVHMCSTSIMACWICGTRATNHLRKCHGQTKVYSAICLRRLRARPNPYLQDQFGRRPTCLWPFQASACHTSTWCNLPISYCLLQVSHGSNSLTKRNLSIKHVTGSDVGTKWKGRAILMKYLMANMNQLWIVNVMWGWTTATTSRFQRRAIFTGRMSWPDALIVFLNLTHHTNYQPEMILKPYWVSFSHPPLTNLCIPNISKAQLQDFGILGFQLLGPLCRLQGSRRSQFHESLAGPNPGECRLQRLNTMKQISYHFQPHCNFCFDTYIAKGITKCRIKPNAAAWQQGAHKISESTSVARYGWPALDETPPCCCTHWVVWPHQLHQLLPGNALPWATQGPGVADCVTLKKAVGRDNTTSSVSGSSSA